MKKLLPNTLIADLFHNPAHRLTTQLFRYLIAGAVAFGVDFGLLYALTTYAGLHYMWSQLVGYTVGLVITYVASVWWVYDARRTHNIWVEFTVFALIGGVGVGLTSLLMWMLTDWANLYYLFSKIVTTGVVMIWNFTARKRLLFTHKTLQSCKNS